jgi:hypothetical protein
MIKKDIKDVDFLILVTLVTLFFPLFQPYAGLLLEQVLTLLLTGIGFFFLLANRKRKIKRIALTISLIYMSLLIISVLRSLDILIINDLFELGKPLYFLMFFSIGYNIRWNNLKVIKYFSSLMMFLFIAALIGIGEAVNPLINAITSILYKDQRPVLTNKAVFSFISPYTFATVSLFPIFFYFVKIMKQKNLFFLCDLSKFLIFTLCLILTQSRTIFISFIITFIMFFILVFYNKWFPNRQKIITVIVIVVSIIVISIPFIVSFAENNLHYLYGGLNAIFSQLNNITVERFIYSSNSISNRFEQIVFAIEHQDKIPLIGVGIGKAILMPESFYAMYYFRTGLIGICIHFGLILYSIYWALYFSRIYATRGLKNKSNFLLTSIFFSIAIYFMSFFFDYLSSAVNDQTRSGFVFYVLVAILCFYKKHYKKMRIIEKNT